MRGMSHSYQVNVKKPYPGKHKILSIVGSLEYANGSIIGTDDGVSCSSKVEES
jgi:hypothetical protein